MNICLRCEKSPGLGINGLRQKAHLGGGAGVGGCCLVSQQQGWGALWWSEQEWLGITEP